MIENNDLKCLNEFENKEGFILIGSAYFFKNLPGYEIHDLDYGKFVDYFPIFKDTCHTIKDGNCYFLWKRKSPEEYISYLKNTNNLYAIGKFLIPEICKEIGFTIDHLKQLRELFNDLDENHQYEKIIYDAYIYNNDFILTDEQLMKAYNKYLNARKQKYEKYYKYIYFIVHPAKFRKISNKFKRPHSIIAIYSITDQERPFILETFEYFKKTYPNLIAYESLNEYEFNDLNLNNYLYIPDPTKNLGNIISIDVDMKNLYSDKVENDLKKELQKLEVHCDLQRSPHGFHLITDRENEKKICKVLKDFKIKKEYIIKENEFAFFKKDVTTNTKLLDGSVINDFKISTEKNWI